MCLVDIGFLWLLGLNGQPEHYRRRGDGHVEFAAISFAVHFGNHEAAAEISSNLGCVG